MYDISNVWDNISLIEIDGMPSSYGKTPCRSAGDD